MAVRLHDVLPAILALLLLHGGQTEGTTQITGIYPHVGSLNGGTNIKIFGEGIPTDFSMTFTVLSVRFLSSTHQYPCDVEETSVSTGQIECYTRAMPSGVYTPQVTLCSSADDCRDILCQGDSEADCTFETKTHYTPFIKSVTPTTGYPGTMLTVYGRIITSLYGSEVAESTNGRTETIKRCYLDGAGQTCELRDSNGDMYGIEMDDDGSSRWGTFQAMPQGKFVGHQNVSIIVSDTYGRSAGTWEAKRVSASMKMYNFQTYAKVSSVSPSVGSTEGRSTITVTGDWFDPTSQVATVTVGGEDCTRQGEVTDNEIVCLTPKKPANEATSYAGNRGVYREVWVYADAASMPALADLPADLTDAPTEEPVWSDSFSWTGRDESYISRQRGFFVPPNDNDYQFVLQDCNKPSDDFFLYFSSNGGEDDTLDVLSCPDSGRRWSARYSLTGGESYYMEVRYRHEASSDTQQDTGVALKMFDTDYLGGQNYHSSNEKQRITITETITREKQHVSLGSEVQDFTLQYGGVQSDVIRADSSANQVKSKVEQMFQTVCPDAVANPDQAIKQFFEDYDGESNRPETGIRVEADETEPFCGRKSLKNPWRLYETNPDHNLYGIDPNMDKVMCFAYKGNIASSLGFRFLYGSSGEETEETAWFGSDDDLSLDFAADENWQYTCVNLQELFSNTRPQATNVRIQDIYVTSDEGSDDFFIDNFFIGKVEPMEGQDVTSSRRLAAQLNGILVQNVEVDRANSGYDVTFIPYNCGHNFPLMEAQVTCTGDCDVNIEQLQAASPPVLGSFQLAFDGRVATVPSNATDEDLAAILKLELDIDAKVERHADCYGYLWDIEWLLDGGDKTALEVDGADLTGTDVTIEQSNINNGGLWFNPIPGDMLRTWHDGPQVAVSINNIPSRCEGDCSFSWAAENTPTITSVTPEQGEGGAEVVIAGTGFSTECDDIRVMIGHTEDADEGVVCAPTTCTFDSITCTVGSSGRGQQRVKVKVLPHGDDPDANPNGQAEGVVDFTYLGTVTGISPTTCGLGGGVELAITGSGFAEDDVPRVGGVDCTVLSRTSEQIICMVPPGSAGSVDVTVHGEDDMTAGDQFAYDNALTPTITAYSPTQSSVTGGDTLTIEGSGFGNSPSLFFVSPEETVEVDATVTGSGITSTLPALGPGTYDILLHVDGSGYGVMDGSTAVPTIEYVLRVTGMSPASGSLSGGTLVGIAGEGFSTNGEENEVMFGDTICEVLTSSDTEVCCKMGSAGRQYAVDNSGTHPDFGDGYAWSHSVLTIAEGDTVVWTWSADTPGVGFAVTQIGTDGEVSEAGFSSGSKTGQGSYSYTFNVVGDFYYTSGCVNDDCEIEMPGKVEVVQAADQTETLLFKINGMEATYSPSGAEPVSGEACPGSTSAVLACSEDLPTASSDAPFSFAFRSCLTATVTSFSPTHGTTGDTITIHGTGFSTDACENEVLIGEYSCDITSATSNSITCQVNPDNSMPVGTYLPVSVNVKNRGNARMATPGAEESRMFALLPEVTSVSPNQGSTEGGTQLTIRGSGFASGMDSTTATVGTVPCDIQSLTYTEIICITQAASERTRNVTVTQTVNGNPLDSVCDSANGGCEYGYKDSATPSISTIDPTTSSGAVTDFTITGTLFGTSVDDITVTFGETTSCSVTSVTDDTVTCTAGNVPVGDQAVGVHVAGLGNAASTTSVSSQAVINDMSPTEGSLVGGTTLTISGNGFGSDSQITMGDGEICDVQSVDLSTVTCITPAATSDSDHTIQVSVVSNGQTYPSQDFTYSSAQTPDVNAITPAEATSGTSVTIAGSGFGQTTDDNEVSIDGTICAVDTSSDTEIVCTLGDHVAGSDYVVDVKVAGKGMARSEVTFNFELSLTAVAPSTGSFGGGRTLSLTGAGFADDVAVTVCDLPCPVISVGSTEIQCELPAHDGVASGTVTCAVAAAVGEETRTLADAFTYDSSLTPVISAVSPGLGGTAGGTTVTIAGTNLGGITSVSIAGSDCVFSGTPSDTEIVCVTEAHSGSVRAKVRAEGTDGIATQENADFYYVDRWSSVYTWGGEEAGLPVEGDLVTVLQGQTLLLDTDTPILRMLLIQGGTLLFYDEGDVHLQAEYILITDGGTLQVGTEEEPFQHQATITLHGHLRSKELPIYGAKVLGVRHGTLDLHGSPVPVTWTQLSQTADAGATTIVLQQPVTWQAGDSIVIATTGYRHSQSETEVREIASVAADGVTITITEPLEYQHISVEETFADSGVTLETRGEVALLTRNVVIRGSDDPSWHGEIEACEEGFDTGEFVTQTCFQGRFGEEVGNDQFGGHVLIHQPEPSSGHVTARIEHVELTYVGQAFRLGRYPIHFHLNGDMSNAYVRGCAIHTSFNRAVTMHGTHNLLVERNVLYNIMGGAFFIEDGIETGNVIQYNLAVFVKASTSLLNDDITPAAYWVTNPNNTIQHNHAAGGTHFGFWYRMHEHPDGASFDPNICPQRVPLGIFQNNTVHSQGWFGIWIFQDYYPAEGGSCSWGARPEPAVFRTLTAWRNEKGAEWVNVGAVQFEGFVMADNEKAGIDLKRIKQLSEWGHAKITDVTLIGHSAISADDECSTAGLILPFARYLTVDGAKVINFDRSGCAAFRVTSIDGTCGDLCSGFPYRAQGVEYYATSNKGAFRWEHEGWIEDLDGSVTGTVGGKVVPSSDTLPPTCAENDDFSVGGYPGSVCTDADLRFHRFAFNGVQPTSLDMRNAIFTNAYGTTTVPWAQKRMTHKMGWMLIMVGRETYTFSFEDSSQITNMTYSGTFYEFEDNDYIIMQHELTQTPDRFSVVQGDNRDESAELVSYANNENADWYFDEDGKIFSYIVSGKGESSLVDRGVKMQVYRCYYEDCIAPADPNDVPPSRERPDDYVTYTDVAWETDVDGFLVPSASTSTADRRRRRSLGIQADDNVKITGVSWLVLGDTNLPRLGKLYIYTVLELWDPDNPYTRDYTLEATHIFIQGGRLVVGWPDNPYLGNIHIILHGDHNTPDMPVPNGPNVGAKAIGVFGGLDLIGKDRNVYWTHLAETAAAGANSITLADAVDWEVDEEIVITTTSFDAWQTETFKITAVSDDGRTVTVNSSLAYDHIYHSDTVNGKPYTMAAEVGLLTRNIKIEGADYPSLFTESFGARVLVGSFNTGGQTYTGYARIKNVEFYHTGQEGWNAFYDPRYSLAFVNTGDVTDSKPSKVENNAFHNGFSPGIGVYGTNNLEITNNVVHHTVGQGMIIEGSRNVLTGNLIALSIWPGAYQDRKEEASQKWEAALEIMDGTNIVLKDNVIAGAERVGLHLDGEPCPGTNNPVDSWSGNVIHSALHGIHLYEDGLPECSMISNFVIYKCFSYGVYFQSVSSAVLNNVTSIDNRIGSFTSIIGPPSLSHQGVDKFVRIQDSLFVGRSPAFSCEDDVLDLSDDNIEVARNVGGLGFVSEKETAGGHIGVSFPGYISGFSGSPFHSWDTQMSYPALLGLTEVEGVTFSNFGEACGGVQDVVFHTWNANEDLMHPIETEGIQLVDVDTNNIAFIGRPSLGKINPADCVDMECDGKKATFIKDRDGSLLGSPGALLPQAEWEWDGDPRRGLGDYRIPKTMLADINGNQRDISEVVYGGRGIIRPQDCENSDELQAHSCHGLNYEMLLIESLDADTETRRLSPVALLADGYIDLLNGPQDHGWCAGYTCQKRISTFWAVVATEKEYLIHFSGVSPQNLRLQLLNTDPDHSIVVGIYFSRPERLDVYVDGSFVEPKNFDSATGGIVAGKHMPTLDDTAGANFMDIEWQTLYFTMTGSTPITIKQTNVVVLTFGMPPVTVEDFFSSDQLVTNLCLFLNIPADKVRVMNVVREDSRRRRRRAADTMTVEIQIGDSATQSLNATVDNSLSYDDLVNLTSVVVDAVQTGSLNAVFGTNVTSASVVEPVPPVGSEEWAELTVDQTEAEAYVLPGSIIVHTEPEPLHEMAAFSVQPRIQALDQSGNHMAHLGHTSAPWEVTASLQLGANSDSNATLSGTVSVAYVDGWANFTDLTVTHSGDDYTILFTVSQSTNVPLVVQTQAFTVARMPVRAAVLSQPETATVDEPFSLQLELRDAVTGQALPDISWKGLSWFATVSLMEPVPGLYRGSLSGDVSTTFNVSSGLATFNDISLTDSSRYHLQFHISTNPPTDEYDFTYSPEPIDIHASGFQMPVGVSRDAQITFDADFSQTIGDNELYFETFMLNVLNGNYSTVYFSEADASAGSVIVTFTITGPEEEVEAVLLQLWNKVKQPMVVTFNGVTMETVAIMFVEGQRYYGTDELDEGPDVAMIAAVSSVAVLAVVVAVLIVVYLYKKTSRKIGGTSPDVTEEVQEGGKETSAWGDFRPSSAIFRPTSALGFSTEKKADTQSPVILSTAQELKDLEANMARGNPAFSLQETRFDKADVMSRPMSRSSPCPRPVSPPGYVLEEENDVPEPRNLTVKLLDKLRRVVKTEKTWLDTKKPLSQIRQDLVAAFPAQLGWKEFMFLTPGLSPVAAEVEHKYRLKDIVDGDVVTIRMA